MNKEKIANDCENLVIEINKLHEECLPGFAMVQSINLLQTYIIKALEADVPKELTDCLLSDEVIIDIWKEEGFDEDNLEYEKALLEEQIKAVAPYIEAEKLRAYNQGISSNLLAGDIVHADQDTTCNEYKRY